MCFYNKYEVGKQYIIFLRSAGVGDYRSYAEEEGMEKESSLLGTCGLGVLSKSHGVALFLTCNVLFFFHS